MKKIIIVTMLLLGYCLLLWVNSYYDSCDAVCRVSCADGSSACFYDYTFEIQSVGNVEYNYIVGEKFTLREGGRVIGSSSYGVGDKVTFKLGVGSFLIKNHKIFPFRFFSIDGNNDSFLIGMK